MFFIKSFLLRINSLAKDWLETDLLLRWFGGKETKNYQLKLPITSKGCKTWVVSCILHHMFFILKIFWLIFSDSIHDVYLWCAIQIADSAATQLITCVLVYICVVKWKMSRKKARKRLKRWKCFKKYVFWVWEDSDSRYLQVMLMTVENESSGSESGLTRTRSSG